MGLQKEILGLPQSLVAKSRIPRVHTQGTRILLPREGHPCSGSGAHPSVGPLLLQLGLAPSAGGPQLSPILCSHLCARLCPSPRPSGCICPKRNYSHSLFTTHYQDSVLSAKPCPSPALPGPPGWTPAGAGAGRGGRGSPHLIPSDAESSNTSLSCLPTACVRAQGHWARVVL